MNYLKDYNRWYLEEKEEFLTIKYFENQKGLKNYIKNNKEIANIEYKLNNYKNSLEIKFSDYLNLPKNLRNKIK